MIGTKDFRPSRVLMCSVQDPDFFGDTVATGVGSIIVLDRGPHQYDVRNPWVDLGACKTHTKLVGANQVVVPIAQMSAPPERVKQPFTLACLSMDYGYKKVVGSVYRNAVLDNLEELKRFIGRRGENIMLPMRFKFTERKGI